MDSPTDAPHETYGRLRHGDDGLSGPVPSGPRFDARALIAAVTLSLVSGLVAMALLVHQRERDLDQGSRLTEAFATVVDEQTTRTVEALDQRLELIAQRLGPSGLSDTLARAMLGEQLERLPFVSALLVLDTQGQVRFATTPVLQGTAHDDKDYFEIFRTRPGTLFYLGRPQQEPGSPDWVLPASRPVVDASGNFSGVVVATLQASHFNDLWGRLALESGSAMSLVRTDGTMMLRSPLDPAAMGRNYVSGPLFNQFLPMAANGSFRMDSPIDGSERLFAYSTLERFPDLVVVVGRTFDVVLAPWRQMLLVVAVGWLLGSLTLTFSALYLGRLSARRQRAERRTLALAQRLSMASEAAGLVLWDWDPRSDDWYATPTQFTTLGFPPHEGTARYREWLALVHPDDVRIVDAARQLMGSVGASVYDFAVRMRHADGSYRWMHTIGQVRERDAQGRPTRLIGIRTDITERKRAENERHQMLERITDGFIALDAEWRFIYVNQQAGILLRRDPQTLIGKSIWSELPPLPGEEFPALCRQAMANQQPARIEAYYPDMGLWIEDHVYPSPDGISIYFRDITQRKSDELALRQAKEHAENLIANANMMIVGLDAHGNVTLFNKVAQDLTGYTLADLAGRNWFDVLCPRHRYPDAWQEFERISRDDTTRHFENPVLTRSGKELTIAWQNSMLRGGEQASGTLSFGIDVTARRQAEQDLAESRDQFETLADSSMQGIALVRKGQLAYINPALCRIAGRSETELTRLSLSQLMQWLHPDDRAASIERQRSAMLGEATHALNELRILHADGQWRWIQSATRSITLRGETAMLAMVIDIHELKLAEVALRASEERLRATLNALPDLMFEIDLQGRYHDYHSRRNDLLLAPPDKLMGRRVGEVMPAEAAETVMAGLNEALAHNHVKGLQIALTLPGGLHWFELSIARKATEPGEVPRFIVLSRDVSERIRTQDALRESEALMRQMADSVSQMFWLIDMRQNRYLYISPAVDAVLGCSVSDLSGNPQYWRRNIHTLDRERVDKQLALAWLTGSYDIELRLLHPDGSLRWIHARAYPVYDEDQVLYRCAGVIEDITARKTLEIREEQGRDMLQYLASGRSMSEMLEKFVLGYEAMVPGMLGSLLLLDAAGTRLHHGAAPHLPQAFRVAIDGMAIGPAAGSCGTAAYTGEAVIAADIATDPRWVDYRDLALQHQLRACWSVPIKGMQGQALGTFAFYFDHVRHAKPGELATIERGAQLASQAIERQLALREPQDSEQRYLSLVESSPEGIVVHQDGRLVYANPAAAAIIGARSAQEVVGRPVMDFVHPQDHAQVRQMVEAILQHGPATAMAERRYLRLDGTVVEVEDKGSPIVFQGAPAVKVVFRDISARKRAEV